MKVSIKKIVISITVLTALLALAACGNSQNTTAEEQSKSSNSDVSHTSLSEKIADKTTINKSTSDVFQSSEDETTVTTSIETSQVTASTTVYETSSESTQVSICETTHWNSPLLYAFPFLEFFLCCHLSHF